MRRIFTYLLGSFIFLLKTFSAQELVIGTTSAYAPFVSLNEAGVYVGFDIDVANALAKKLNRSLVIKDLGSMPSLFLALKQKKVDALLWAISITKQRQKQMAMIYYQGKKVTKMPLLFWKEIPQNFTTIEAMAQDAKLNLSVEAGSYQEAFLLTILGLNLKQVDKVMDGILELKYGKTKALLIDPSLLLTVKEKFPQIQAIDIPLPADFQSLGNGICVNKANVDLIAAIEKAVGELIAEGIISELEVKWNLVGK